MVKIKIPEQLLQEEINFVLLERGGKKPFQNGWQNKRIKYDDTELQTHLKNGEGYKIW